MSFNFDVIVVGAGHAGIEACLATSRLGLKTAMITSNVARIGYMSCNPSIGGLAKGHMVREIDILGGQMGAIADETCIQFKRLNATRGPAVRGTRTQNDKVLYNQRMVQILSSQKNLTLFEAEVKKLSLDQNICSGVYLEDGSKITAKTVIITTGTFMNGVMHVGLSQTSGGRVGDKASIGLSDQLKNFGFNVQRLKTGTPARLIRDSIDWSQTTAEHGDKNFYPFSFRSSKQYLLPQVACYLSRTTEKTHEIIRNNLDKSPMFCGFIEGSGPRYCPSIEDKVTRFADRESHQTFLEPESLQTDLIYLQGISTSLPQDVQDEFLRTIPGLENVKVARYGYAVEYDFIEPTQIWHRLETRPIENLFLAGQINGTSGYEEAASQGLVAGINAANKILGREELILNRDEAYIGVLIDDLVTKGTREPYRMFTSRAEHRLILREDNTADRLLERSRTIGLCEQDYFDKLALTIEKRSALLKQIQETKLYPNQETQEKLKSLNSRELLKPITAEELLRRHEISPLDLNQFGCTVESDPDVYEPLEIEVKYSGYIEKQKQIISQTKKFEENILPNDVDYRSIRGLSNEEVEKLLKVKPRTLGQAQRISGVNPSAIQAIMIHLKVNKSIGAATNESTQKSRRRSTNDSLSHS